MIRWLYTWLICLHPARFRERFGEQMTSVFDESLRQRGGIRLLADAVVSVLRQQLFWSDSSERCQVVARGLNLIWILSVIPVEIFVASELHPTQRLATPQFCMRYCPYLCFWRCILC